MSDKADLARKEQFQKLLAQIETSLNLGDGKVAEAIYGRMLWQAYSSELELKEDNKTRSRLSDAYWQTRIFIRLKESESALAATDPPKAIKEWAIAKTLYLKQFSGRQNKDIERRLDQMELRLNQIPNVDVSSIARDIWNPCVWRLGEVTNSLARGMLKTASIHLDIARTNDCLQSPETLGQVKNLMLQFQQAWKLYSDKWQHTQAMSKGGGRLLDVLAECKETMKLNCEDEDVRRLHDALLRMLADKEQSCMGMINDAQKAIQARQLALAATHLSNARLLFERMLQQNADKDNVKALLSKAEALLAEKQAKVRELLKEAREANVALDYPASRKHCQDALNLDKDNREANDMLGQIAQGEETVGIQLAIQNKLKQGQLLEAAAEAALAYRKTPLPPLAQILNSILNQLTNSINTPLLGIYPSQKANLLQGETVLLNIPTNLAPVAGLAYRCLHLPRHGTLTTVDATRFRYQPNPEYIGADYVTMVAHVKQYTSAPVILSFEIKTNQPPQLLNGGFVTNKVGSVSEINLARCQARDPEGRTNLTYRIVTLPRYGSIDASRLPILTYRCTNVVLSFGKPIPDELVFTVSDGVRESDLEDPRARFMIVIQQ